MQDKVTNLLVQLRTINPQDKNIIVNFSTSQYAKFSSYSQILDSIDSSIYQNIKIILFSSPTEDKSLYFYNITEYFYFTNDATQTCKMLDQNQKQEGKKKIFVYFSSIKNSNSRCLDDLEFLDTITMFLRQYIGRVILEMHPIYQEKFDQKLKNLKKYFYNLYKSQIIELNQEPKDYYFIRSKKTRLNIDASQFSLTNLSNVQGMKNQTWSIKSIFQNNQIEPLRLDKILYLTGDVLKCFEKYKIFFEFNEKQQERQKQYKLKAEQIRNWMDFDFDHPELQMILSVYQKYGIMFCELRSLSILKRKFQQRGIQESYLQDDDFTEDYKSLQQTLKRYLLNNIQRFPIIITDSPLIFLEGGQFSFKYVEIEDDFYNIASQCSFQPDVQLKKIIYRNNNQNNGNHFLFTFINEETLQLFKKCSQTCQIKQDQKILQYPLNLEQRFRKYNKLNQKLLRNQKQKIQNKSQKTIQTNKNNATIIIKSNLPPQITTKNGNNDTTKIIQKNLSQTQDDTLNKTSNFSKLNDTILEQASIKILPDDILNNNQQKYNKESPQSLLQKYILCDINNQYYYEKLEQQFKIHDNQTVQFYSQKKDFLINLLKKNWAFILKITPQLYNKARQKILFRLKKVDICWKTDYQNTLKSIPQIQLQQILQYFHEKILLQVKNKTNDSKKIPITLQNYQYFFKMNALEKKYICKDFKSFLKYCFNFESLYQRINFQNPINDMSQRQQELFEEFMKNIKKTYKFQEYISQKNNKK